MVQDRDDRALPPLRPAPAREADVFASADVFAAPAPLAHAPPPLTIEARAPAADARPRSEDHLDAGAIMASVGELPYRWTIESDALSWGANAGRVLGCNVTQIASGRAYAKLLTGDTATCRFDTIMKSPQRDDGHGVAYQVQYALQQAGAENSLWIEDTGRWFAGADGKPTRAQGIVRVINERHDREERLNYLSRFDALTGEMNRYALNETLDATLKNAVAQRQSCGFMLVAVDNLARINEFYGFDIADEAINAVAKRLRAKMRGGDQLGRFSGNKFGIILNNCTPEDMEKAAERLVSGVRDDVIRTSAGPVAVTVTIGGVTAPRHAGSLADVMNRAQETLDRAKAKRIGSYQVYRPNVEREALRRDNVRAADEIVNALNERRILLAFEPVVATDTRAPAFYECLMRVRRADGALVPAQEVIPVAERLGLVRLLDHRVVEMLVGEMAAVPTLHASMNVSPASLTDPDWWSALDALLRANPGVAERMIVEITETTVIHDIDDTRGFVSRVRDLGCRIAIDDFGSGYTSFRNLRKLGIDILKIDGAFVKNLMRSEDDRAFVSALLDLARRLGIKTVAEWVQDEPSAKLLQDWGCDYLQGALIGLAQVERPWGDAVPVDRRKALRS